MTKPQLDRSDSGHSVPLPVLPSEAAAQPPHDPARAAETARLAVLLAWVAGGVDAIGYLVLAHLFTAHMSGNSVAFGAAIGHGEWDEVIKRGMTIAIFAIGIAVGTAVGELCSASGRRHPTVAVFTIEAVLLGVFLVSGSSAMVDGQLQAAVPWPFFAFVALPTLAMGLQSATLRRVGSASVRTTYISGVLTSLMEVGVECLFWLRRRGQSREGGDAHSPVDRLRVYGTVLGAYVLGAVLGSVSHSLWGLTALLLPIAGLALAVARDLRHPHELAATRTQPQDSAGRR
jgi:uncharacterized membrane protein YoaK (UPF0700 family)